MNNSDSDSSYETGLGIGAIAEYISKLYPNIQKLLLPDYYQGT